MTINTTRWKPDTCDCILEYTWDSEEPEATRIHTFKVAEGVCQMHSSLSGAAIYNVVVAENRLKNFFVEELINTVPRYQQVDDRGGKTLKDSVKYQWNFVGHGAMRLLNITLDPPLTPPEKAQVQTKLLQRFGSDGNRIVIK